MSSDRVRCDVCCGSGRRDLSPSMQKTLDTLRVLGQARAVELAESMGVNHTTMIWRLNAMAAEGLVVRRRWPKVRGYVWVAAKVSW